MLSRNKFLVAAAAMTVALLVGVAVLGFFQATTTDEPFNLYNRSTAAAIGSFGKLILAVILASSAAGFLGWLAMYLLRRDGSHRMETVAFLPINYGGRDAFDTSDGSRK